MQRRRLVVAASAALVVVLAGVGIWWFAFRGDAPDAVTLDAAVEAAAGGSTDRTVTTVVGSTSVGTAGSPAGDVTGAGTEGIDGTWTVDTSIGTFDFESATGSFVGFRVDEELTVGSVTAVGRTGSVDGAVTIDATQVTDVTIDAQLSELTTDDSRRDRAARGALGTGEFPTATFELSEPIELGAGAARGEPVAVTAAGELTVKGVTRAVEIPIEAQLADGVIALVGSTEVEFADFGVTPPSAPIVVSVEDHGTIELQLLLTRS